MDDPPQRSRNDAGGRGEGGAGRGEGACFSWQEGGGGGGWHHVEDEGEVGGCLAQARKAPLVVATSHHQPLYPKHVLL